MTAMTTPTEDDAGREPADYLLRKRGYFYRPKAQGYTASVFEAGRYTKAEAESCADRVDGVTMHHVSEYLDDRDGLCLDRTSVRAIICQIPNGDLAAMLLKQIDALPIFGGAQPPQPSGDVKELVMRQLRILNELVTACQDEFCSEDTEKGDWREPDDESVAVGLTADGKPNNSVITFGIIRDAAMALAGLKIEMDSANSRLAELEKETDAKRDKSYSEGMRAVLNVASQFVPETCAICGKGGDKFAAELSKLRRTADRIWEEARAALSPTAADAVRCSARTV